ncbi:hypothetical protein [Paracidovorax citrulli]|uniref:hypothetical protein n=1 Tax=Paracidovorax citrulli TaxID=80869 RepID=UPI001FAFFE24|nr:hypothetical protein [Paracidovorax citrulli]
MAITLTYLGTTAHISDRLVWTDEYSWSPVDQATAYSTTGALLVDVAVKQAGRPITLVGTETIACIQRALCDTLQAWASLPASSWTSFCVASRAACCSTTPRRLRRTARLQAAGRRRVAHAALLPDF